MKKTILAGAALVALGSGVNVAYAEEAAAQPEHAVAYNIGAVSEYRYRGISQSRFMPAVNGGIDYTHNPSGFYLGTWASTIRWIKDGGATDGNVEIDIYGGKRGELTKDLAYDVGVLQYWYPGNTYGDVAGYKNANTTELYGQLGMGPAYLKYSHAVTNLFGFTDSKNSYYLDAGANLPLDEGLVLNLHLGYQKVKNVDNADFTDWKIGVTKDFGFVTGTAAIIGANSDKAVYYSPAGNNTGKTTLVLGLTKAF